MKTSLSLLIVFLAFCTCKKDDDAPVSISKIVSLDIEDAIFLYEYQTNLNTGKLFKMTEDQLLAVDATWHNASWSKDSITEVAVNGIRQLTEKYIYIMLEGLEASSSAQVILYEKATGVFHNLSDVPGAYAFSDLNHSTNPIYADRAGNIYFGSMQIHCLDANLTKVTSYPTDRTRHMDVNLDGIICRLHNEEGTFSFTLPSGVVLKIEKVPDNFTIARVFLGWNNEHFYVSTYMPKNVDDTWSAITKTYRLSFTEQAISLSPCGDLYVDAESLYRPKIFPNDKRKSVCNSDGEFYEDNCMVSRVSNARGVDAVTKDFFVMNFGNGRFGKLDKTDYRYTDFEIDDLRDVKLSCSPTSNYIGFNSSPAFGYFDENNKILRFDPYHPPRSFTLIK